LLGRTFAGANEMGPVAIGAESDQIEDVAPRTLHAMANPAGHLMKMCASVLPIERA